MKKLSTLRPLREDGVVLVNGDWCIGCKLCSWACPYGAREYDADAGVMKKCTLCVDKIYNETLPPESRVPACVSTCPAGARHFGDLGDPDSGVSKLVAARGGYDLMPEQGCKPTNKYLPPRPREDKDLRDESGRPAPDEAGQLRRFLELRPLRWRSHLRVEFGGRSSIGPYLQVPKTYRVKWQESRWTLIGAKEWDLP